MRFDLISFDLQGTLSDSAFSDEFWLELLPVLYSENTGFSLESSRATLKTQFSAMGKYDSRYYSAEHWIQQLCPTNSFSNIIGRLANRPSLYSDLLELVQDLKPMVPLAIISTTTRGFIDLELGNAALHFKHIYSSLDDLNIPGKPPTVFLEVASRLGFDCDRLLHVGDCPEMDVTNAMAAGWHAFHFDKKAPRNQLIASLRQLIDCPAC